MIFNFESTNELFKLSFKKSIVFDNHKNFRIFNEVQADLCCGRTVCIVM